MISYICGVKSILRHIMLLALTLSVLLGSFGVALSKQFCEITGVQSFEASSLPDSCCEDALDSKADDCCEEHVSYQKLEPVQGHKQYHVAVPFLAYITHTPSLPTYVVSINPQLDVYTFTNSSPPLYGRQLLHFLHTLIV